MLDHAKEAVDLIAGKNKIELQHDRVLQFGGHPLKGLSREKTPPYSKKFTF
jgi:hypothetical protein